MHVKQQLIALPKEPGIYKMLDENNVIIYIGKAKNIKKRVSSYFSKQHEDLKTKVLVSKIVHIDFIVTRTEEEALILERQLIREFKPRYNILLKDDKSYPYIKITLQEPFPRVLVTREKNNDGAKYFGPYPSIGSAHHFQKPYKNYSQYEIAQNQLEAIKKQRKCIQLDIGNCIGPCIYKEVKGEYDKLIQQLLLLLKGENKTLVRELKQDMTLLSNKQEYEKAASIRDKIIKLEALYAKQIVDRGKRYDFHIWTLHENEDKLYVLVQKLLMVNFIPTRSIY